MFQALTVIKAPASEPVSTDLARQHIRVDHNLDDSLIALYVSVARTLAEDYTGRAFVLRQLRYSISDSPPGSQWPLTAVTPVILPLWLPYPLVFQSPIRLPRFPVQSIDRVAVSHTGQLTDQVLDPKFNYTSDLTGAPARLLLMPSAQPALGQHVMVDFTAGYDPAVEPIPASAKMAVLFGAAWLYENRGDTDIGDLPPAFYALLTPLRMVTFG